MFRNNLASITLNECVKVTALVDTGACVTVMNLNTLKLLRQQGQNCKLFKRNNIKLSSISGSKLHVIGCVYIRLLLGSHLLRMPVYVINNMHNSFVLGSDAMSKYKIVIDYEKEELQVKSEVRLLTAKTIKILPKSNAIIPVYSNSNILIPGLMGKIFENKMLHKKGLKGITVSTSVCKKGIIRYKVSNRSNKTICLAQKTFMGNFCPMVKNKIDDIVYKDNVKELIYDKEEEDNIDLETDVSLEQLYSQYVDDKEINAINIANESNETLNFNVAGENLTNAQKVILTEMLNKNRHVFATHAYDLGEMKSAPFKINLKQGAQPVKSLPHRASPKQRQVIDEQVEKLLKAGIIEPCESQFSSPVVLVPKEYDENGKIMSQRLCVDYRKLNNITTRSTTCVNRIADMLDSLGEAKPKYFSVIDCLQGYHQIRVDEDSKDMTAFVTHSGVYRWNRLPFGLSNAPSHFIAAMNNLFRKLLYKGVLIYLDDILVYSDTYEKHVELLQEVFDILTRANIKLKLAKCKFALRQLRYLGHIISALGLGPDPKKLESIREFPRPKNLREVRGFVGLCSFFRRFVPNFSKISQPLTRLTRKDTPFEWSDECQTSFEILKEKLINHPIVGYPIYDQSYLLYTDASGYSVAGVLCQKQGEHERMIACTGRNMLPAESRYSAFEKEALAIFYCFKQFDSYIRYTHVDVITDCKVLCEILTKKPPNLRLAKWTFYLCQFDYSVMYRAGAMNHVDALSRIKYTTEVTADEIEPSQNPYIDALMINELGDNSLNDNAEYSENQAISINNLPYGEKLTLELISEEQKFDSKLAPIINYIINDLLPEDEKLARKIVLQSTNYNVTDNLLYHQQVRRQKGNQQLNIQLVIPSNLRLTVLKEHHENLGHRGTPAVFNSISKNYFWENMYKDCYDHVHSCHACMQHKHKQKKDRDILHPIATANRPFMIWFIDPVGPLPKTKNNNCYILTCVDSFSKVIEAIPLQNITSYSLAKAFFENIICRYGSCETIVTDMGANLCSVMMEHLFSMCKSVHMTSTSFHHETVGQCERGNQIIERMIAKYVNADKTNWDETLPLIRLSHNVTENAATGASPYLIIHGREPKLPLDIALQKPDKINRNMENELEDLIQKVTTLDKMVKENIDNSKITMKKAYDKHATPCEYKIGQLVWLFLYKFPKKMGGHFKTPYIGPFRIIAQEGVNYKLRRLADNVILPVAIHPNRLQLVYDKNIKPPMPLIQPPRMSQADEELLTENITESDIDASEIVSNNIYNSQRKNQVSSDAGKSQTGYKFDQSVNNTLTANTTDARAHSSLKAKVKLNTATETDKLITDPNHMVSVNSDSPIEQSQLMRPSAEEISVFRPIHAIPKARKINNTMFYYIIYDDQENKNLGDYISENKLNAQEKDYVEQNKDKIKIMRNVQKHTFEINSFEIINECTKSIPKIKQKKRSIYDIV